MDKWLYPEDLNNEDLVVNIYWDEGDYCFRALCYPLPKDWRERVTKDRGKDGKPSINDLLNL